MSTIVRVGVVVAGAGESRRMRGIDKVLTPVLGKPLLGYSMELFATLPEVNAIALVLRDDLVPQGNALVQSEHWTKVRAVTAGGKRRQDSVAAGLKLLADCDWIMVHDGARPCVDAAIVWRGLAAAQETGAAIAAVPAKDTIKRVDTANLVVDTPERNTLWQVQTPQVFRADLLRRAYASDGNDVTDDAALVEQLGGRVKVFMGSYENIKVTTPEDLQVVELFLRARKAVRA